MTEIGLGQSTFTLFILFAMCRCISSGQSAGSNVTTLGLPRLGGAIERSKLDISQYQVDELKGGVFSKGAQGLHDEITILNIDSTERFSRPFRAPRGNLGYVSIQAYCSIGTVVEVGNAKIGISASPMIEDYAQVYVWSVSGKWQSTGINIPAREFDGATLAVLPVLTFRIDPRNGVYDMFSGTRMILEDQNYSEGDSNQFVTISPGDDGVWLMGLVQCDENPLYIDENENGVDDDFEKSHLGRLLAIGAAKAERLKLISDWRHIERRLPPPALFVPRPQPDK